MASTRLCKTSHISLASRARLYIHSQCLRSPLSVLASCVVRVPFALLPVAAFGTDEAVNSHDPMLSEVLHNLVEAIIDLCRYPGLADQLIVQGTEPACIIVDQTELAKP